MKSLLASYFEIVRANLRDLVPKLVMHSLVKQVQSKLQGNNKNSCLSLKNNKN